MKMKKKSLLLVTFLVVALLSSGFSLVAYQVYQGKQEKQPVEQKAEYDYKTFADYTEVEEFKSVPVLWKEGSKISDAYEYGRKSFTIEVSGTNLTDYEEYLAVLQDKGFQKHSDNGEEGMEGEIYTASFQKDALVITVYHIVKHEATYITASQNSNLSDRLICQDSYVNSANIGVQTTVHLLELNDNGNSYVIQLKNGHFIVEDGGNEADAPYLLDYLESLTPEGEKPVIEAWFISHAHADHIGALKKIMDNVQYSNRIYVEGIYFVDPSDTIQKNIFPTDNQNSEVW